MVNCDGRRRTWNHALQLHIGYHLYPVTRSHPVSNPACRLWQRSFQSNFSVVPILKYSVFNPEEVIFIKVLKIFTLLFFSIIVSSCSYTSDHYDSMDIEDPDEITDILEKAQAAEEEINSIVISAEATQEMRVDEVLKEKTVMNVSSSLILDPLAGVINTEMELLPEPIEFRMYLSEDATYLSYNPNVEDERWQKLTKGDHEEIIGDYNDGVSVVNYDVLLEHVDELTFLEIGYSESDKEYYSLEWREGDPSLYFELVTQQNLVDETDETTTVEEFGISLELDKDTGHPMTITTWMDGTQDLEGEDVHITETISTVIRDINMLDEEELRVPEHVKQSAETNE